MSEDACSQAFASIFLNYFKFEIRQHASRHIIATDYLKADPRNIEVVAIMLNDAPETVRKEYAHLMTQDLADHFDSYMSAKYHRTIEYLGNITVDAACDRAERAETPPHVPPHLPAFFSRGPVGPDVSRRKY